MPVPLPTGLKPLVYIAGPISKGDPLVNARTALGVWGALADTHLVIPFAPQLSIFQQFLSPRPYEDWLAYDFDFIEHCQALLRIPGDSPGADREVDLAKSLGIPVFFDVPSLVSWAKAVNNPPVRPRPITIS